MPGGFRLCAKNFFLTYPRCTASKEDLKQFLLTLGISGCLISLEQHADGTPHLHALVCFEKKKDIKNPRFFDFNNFHGKYEPARSIEGSIEYVSKYGDTLEYGELPRKKRSWSTVLSASSKEEALQFASECSARDFIIFNDRIEAFISKKFKPEVPEYTPEFTNFNVPPELVEWTSQLEVGTRPKSLILYGGSRLGKTEWARSLGKHMFFSNFFNLEQWDDDAKYAIFDDLVEYKFEFLRPFLGGQKQFSVTDKYCKKKLVQWGKPAIVLANFLPMYGTSNWITEWLDSNCVIVEIKSPLFI